MGDEGSESLASIKQQNKPLIIALVILGVLIVGLIIGIIVVNVGTGSGQGNGGGNNSGGGTSADGSDDSGDGGPNSGIGMTEEDIARDKYLTELHQSIEEEAERIASTEPVNVAAISALFQRGIDESFKNGSTNYVNVFIYDRTNFLVDKGLKREALDILLGMDWNTLKKTLHGANMYRHYTRIIELAEELGDIATAEKYKGLRAEFEDEYQADYNGTKQYVDSLNNQGNTNE